MQICSGIFLSPRSFWMRLLLLLTTWSTSAAAEITEVFAVCFQCLGQGAESCLLATFFRLIVVNLHFRYNSKFKFVEFANFDNIYLYIREDMKRVVTTGENESALGERSVIITIKLFSPTTSTEVV